MRERYRPPPPLPRIAGLLIAALGLSSRAALGANGPLTPIVLEVDAREAPRRILHASLAIPAAPGPVTLYYPKWLPGTHRPTGPIVNVTGLRISAGGRPVAWSRDDSDVYAFHCRMPPGSTVLDVNFDYVSPSRGGGRFDPLSTDALMVLNWNLVLVYPAGRSAADYRVKSRVRLPPGWRFGTVLGGQQADDTIDLPTVSLVTLVDSPLIAGANFRAVPLPVEGAPRHELDIVADSVAALEVPDDLVQHQIRLVSEAGTLFGAHHYREYRFLLTLSDAASLSGLEHHESSDNRAPERALINEDTRRFVAGLLPHEFVHSWNGKYRRPAGLAPPDYQRPMSGELLWVYEGLTSYLGLVLTARSGLYSPEQFREQLAVIAAEMAGRSGRRWRSLEDTARAAQTLYDAPAEWTSWRRSADFHAEGVLLWLEVDTVIRQRTASLRSLDDFCLDFFGPPSGPPTVSAYGLDDVLAALNRVAAYDWRSFFSARVDAVRESAPIAGIEQAGWTLTYDDRPNELRQSAEAFRNTLDLSDSIGMTVERAQGKATIIDVIPGTPSAQVGLAPGMNLVAVNGRHWSPEALRAALRPAVGAPATLALLVENAGFYKTYTIGYGDGLRAPHLAKTPSAPDMLSTIIRPRAGTPVGRK